VVCLRDSIVTARLPVHCELSRNDVSLRCIVSRPHLVANIKACGPNSDSLGSPYRRIIAAPIARDNIINCGTVGRRSAARWVAVALAVAAQRVSGHWWTAQVVRVAAYSNCR